MANSALIEDYRQGQEHYAQTRYFTPGERVSDVRTLQQGQQRTMDLMVVVHNDVRGAAGGVRVDVQANAQTGSAPRTGPGQGSPYENAHLVNAYNAQTGVTDHTAVYSTADLELIQATGPGARVMDRDAAGRSGAVPGATVYSVTAKMKDVDGQLVIDTDHPLQPGPGVSRYSLHDQQRAMDWAAQDQGNLPVAKQLSAEAQQAQPGSRTNLVAREGSGMEPGQRTGPTAPERSSSTVGTPARRQLPIKGLIDAQAAAGGNGPAAASVDQESVSKAAAQGFTNGFLGGIPQNMRPGAKPVADDPVTGMPAGSPLAALAMVADAAELSEGTSASSAGMKERLARFPELQGVEVPTGNAARFPELAEEASEPLIQEQEQEHDGGYDR